MAASMYGLRAPDTKRQYPRRAPIFLELSINSGNIGRTGQAIYLKGKTKFAVGSRKPHVIYRLSERKCQKRWNSRIYDHQLLQSNQVILCNELPCVKLEEDIPRTSIRKKSSKWQGANCMHHGFVRNQDRAKTEFLRSVPLLLVHWRFRFYSFLFMAYWPNLLIVIQFTRTKRWKMTTYYGNRKFIWPPEKKGCFR